MLSAAAEPDGTRVAMGVESGFVNLVDLDKPQAPIVQLPRPQGDPKNWPTQRTDMVGRLSWERHHGLLAGRRARYDIAASADLVLWDLTNHLEIRPKWPDDRRMFSATFSAATDELLTVEFGGAISVWDTNTLLDPIPRLIERFEESEEPFCFGSLSPDGRWMASLQYGGPDSDVVQLWDRRRPGVKPRLLTDHKGQVTFAEFSPDSQALLTSSADRTARIWNVVAPSARAIELKGAHTAGLTSAAFSPDGKLVATGSRDRTVRIWNAHTGEDLALLLQHGEEVNDVRFTPHGVLSASDDGTVQLRQCAACDPSLTVDELRTRALQLAKLPQSELDELDRE